MLKTRIPLDKIYRVFFCNNSDSGASEEESSNSESNEKPVLMNDFTVIKLGEKPIPEKPPIPKYPRFKKTIIHNNAPSQFYEVRIPPQPYPEYEPPPRPVPREVHPERFTKNSYKREFCGKTAYEQDKLIMKYKKKLYQENNPRQPDPNSIPPNKNAKPPKMYYREAEQSKKKKKMKEDEALLRKRIQEEKDQKLQRMYDRKYRKMKKEKAERERIEREKEEMERAEREKQQRIKEEREAVIREEREMEEKEKAERRKAAREAAEQKEAERKELMRQNFVPDRPTRASKLKDEAIRRKLERSYLDERRLQLNRELRKEIDKEQMKRLEPTLIQMKPSSETKNTAEKMRKEMQKNTRMWNRYLKHFEQDLNTRQTMLQRILEEQESIQFSKEEREQKNSTQKK